VLSSSLTSALEEALADQGGLIDPDTGLVHLGNGRWYDPGLGRPLQPNPMGGPPSVPQALNRYAATAVGQPGVAEAELGGGLSPIVGAFARQVPGATLSLQGFPQLARSLVRPISKPGGTGIVEIVGPRASVRFLEAEGFETLSIRPARGWLRGPLSRIFKGLQIQTLRGEMGIAGAVGETALMRGESVNLGRDVTMRLVKRLNVVDDVATQAAARRLANTLGVGAAGLLSAGFQYASDYDNPYLTGRQKFRRAGISGLLGTGAAGLGLGAEFILVGSAGGPVGIIIAIPIAISFELWLAPILFEAVGAVEQRNLAPLSSQN
jgi:hypothetical protein